MIDKINLITEIPGKSEGLYYAKSFIAERCSPSLINDNQSHVKHLSTLQKKKNQSDVKQNKRTNK